MTWFARSLGVLACTAGTLFAMGPSVGAAPTRHTAQAPVCASAEGQTVCVQGWSTGITFTYSGSSTNAAGQVFQDGSAVWGVFGSGAEPIPIANLAVNWHGSGTLFVPQPAGQWYAMAVANGDHQGPPGASAPDMVLVGPSEPPPPTTCSTVAQGIVPLTPGQPQPWVSGISATSIGNCPGYWIASPSGTVDGVGGASCAYTQGPFVNPDGCYPNDANVTINGPVTGIVGAPGSKGYWLVASDGGVFAFGTAAFYGSMGGTHLNQPIVGMAATPDGKGYWLVASDGGVFAFGDAAYYGSMGGQHLNQPIVGITATADGKGYWIVASDGGVFSYGDAAFRGSLGGVPLNKPIVAVAAASDGSGYWLVASDGGVFAFGAPFLGSLGATTLSAPVVGMSPSPTGAGYYLVGADSAVYAFGNAQYLGAPIQQG